MAVRNLEKLFKPRRIALLGGCDRPDNLGRQCLRNILNGGFEGVVYPVSQECEAIHGIATYSDVSVLPKVPDLAIICGPAATVPTAVERCGEAGIVGVLILSGGFREAGERGRLIEQELNRVVARYPGMRVVGPNSLGIIRPALGLNASHAVAMPKAGHLAFISESRALCNSMMDWATERGIGFSTFIAPGNCIDVGWGDLIDYFGNDPETRAIILYVQTIDAARRFMSAARAFALTKPIVAYKAGRFAESAQAVASHTGAMVAEDAVYDAALQRCGIVRVPELDDVFDVAELLASQRLPKGARLAVVSNAGGPAIIAADALISRGGVLAELGEETVARLEEILPPVGSHRNPVDLLDSAPPERYEQVLPVLLADKNIDGLLVIFAIQSGSDATDTARVVAQVSSRSHIPVLAAWMGGEQVRRAVQVLNEAGLPTHPSPEQAVRAFMHLVSYARNLGSLYETPREIPVPIGLNRRNLRKRLQPLLSRGEGYLTENQAKSFLRAYQIPVCETCVATDEDEAVAVAERIGYPVVLKVLSPNILHKLDVGGVQLNLGDAAAVRAAYKGIVCESQARCTGASIKGVSVQKMVTAEYGLELILGAKKDPTFGAVIMVGMGGVATGVLRDRVVGLPPLNERHVRRMLESLRFWPLLNGYRGRPALHLDRLIEAIIRFSLLIADYPEIKEFDVNPLLVTVDGVTALDAAMVLDKNLPIDGRDLYPHLAIRPCPEEYVRHGRSEDGAAITLRSVRAEDEPMWHSMVADSSPESIRFRFRSLFKRPTHQMAIEHCVIDYERQIAIVAETEARGYRELAGVAQLIADANHETAEFAVLVSDPWQGRKIGGTLLDYCLELAAGWGIERIVAETDPENRRMLDTFRKRGFSAEVHIEDQVVMLERRITSVRRQTIVTRL